MKKWEHVWDKPAELIEVRQMRVAFCPNVYIKPHLMPRLKAYLPLKSKLSYNHVRFNSGTYFAFSLDVKVGKARTRMVSFPGEFGVRVATITNFSLSYSIHLWCFFTSRMEVS